MTIMNDMNKLNQYFQNSDTVLLAYLFGSQASGRIGPMSDYDIGIYTAQQINFDQKYFMEVDLRKILKAQALDLVVMNEAPLALNYNIICGKCIYCADQETRVEYEADILSRFFDFLPTLKLHYQDILNTVKNERQIQRNRNALGETEKLLGEIRTLQRKVSL